MDHVPCWRRFHSLNLNLFDLDDALIPHLFFVTWFRARARVRWVMLVLSACMLGLIRVVFLLVCFFTMYAR
jgi:hypothetical protein